MDVERDTQRWVDAGIITAEQRDKILALEGAETQPLSLAVLALLWAGGSLVFLGVAFLLGILWEPLGSARGFVMMLLDGAFFAAGVWLLRLRPELGRTGIALMVIGGLIFPLAFGITYRDLFGSSGHYMALDVLCGAVYSALAWRLRSRAFAVLACVALFFVGEEVVRDPQRYGVLFPLVQLGFVSSLSVVYPLVFLTLAVAPIGLAFLAGRTQRFAELRGTLHVCGLLLALLPALVGAIDWSSAKSFRMVLALGASAGAMALSVVLRDRRSFWIGAASLVTAFLILFATFFENSIAFTFFAIVVGLVTMGFGTWLAFQKDTWFDRLFAPP